MRKPASFGPSGPPKASRVPSDADVSYSPSHSINRREQPRLATFSISVHEQKTSPPINSCVAVRKSTKINCPTFSALSDDDADETYTFIISAESRLPMSLSVTVPVFPTDTAYTIWSSVSASPSTFPASMKVPSTESVIQASCAKTCSHESSLLIYEDD